MKHFDVKLRLGATFFLLAVIILSVGLLGVLRLRQLDRTMQDVIYDRWSEEQIVREAFRLSTVNNRITLSIFLLDDQDEIRRLLVQRDANSERISGLIRSIEPGLDTEEEKRLLGAIKAARKPYIESYQQALEKLVDEHKTDEARRIVARVTMPQIAVYHAAWNALSLCQAGEIERAIAQCKTGFTTAQRRLLVVILLVVLITSATAVYVTSRVTREIAERERAEEDLRQSNSQLELQVQKRTTELSNSYETLKMEAAERKKSEEALRESEERFSGAFENAPIGMALVSPAGQWLKVNRAVCDLLGYTEAELLTRTFQDITHPEDIELDLGYVRRMIAGEIRTYQLKKRYVHGRGHLVTVLLSVSLVRDSQGQPRYFISQIQDISEPERADAALLESKRFLQSALDALSSHIAILDDHGTIIEVNGAWNRFASENDFIGDHHGVGLNYLHICDSASGSFSEEASVVAAGIRSVMAGQSGEFHVEYPCHGQQEQRWFIVRVTRFGGEGPVRVVVAHENITERKQAEEELRASQQIIEGIINAIPVRVFWKDKNLVYLGCNSMFARDAGFAGPKDIIGKDDYQMGWSDQADLYRGDDRQVIESGNSKLFIEEPQTTPAGGSITLLSSKLPLRSSKGEISGVLGTYMDITERKRLEERLFQSQKMETVGKLAGGVAHEFNSILTAIIGQSELLLGDLPPGNPLCTNAVEIHKAAERAAALTRQLLAYGRKQILQPEILDLNSVLAGMESTLRHMMGQGVDVRIAPAAGLGAVKADAGQIEQVIMNMAMNAAAAMPNGGTLTLETANVTLDQEHVSHFPELKAGEYAMLAITDTGAGMSEEVKARVFEPFFSTKGVGEGTGLGLSTCYGIIKQSGGHISVYSELIRGTAFKIYLPRVEQQAKNPIRRPGSSDLPHGTETILLVEDNLPLREMAVTLLERLGYTVLAAANGIEALELKQQRNIGHIDLLFTDVVMPLMNGKELSERVLALYPDSRILFTSAYTENAIVHQGVLNNGVAFLEKPFTPSALAHKLREVLDQPS